MLADHTAYDVRYSYRPLSGITTVGISIFPIYSFKLKSAFDAVSLLVMPVSFCAVRCVLWLNVDPAAKMSEEVNRKCHARNMVVQHSAFSDS